MSGAVAGGRTACRRRSAAARRSTTRSSASSSRWKNTEVTVTLDGAERRGPMHDVIVANGRWHGGGMKLAPDAEPDDGLFDIVLIGDVDKLDFVTTSPKLYKGGHVGHRGRGGAQRARRRSTRRAAADRARGRAGGHDAGALRDRAGRAAAARRRAELARARRLVVAGVGRRRRRRRRRGFGAGRGFAVDARACRRWASACPSRAAEPLLDRRRAARRSPRGPAESLAGAILELERLLRGDAGRRVLARSARSRLRRPTGAATSLIFLSMWPSVGASGERQTLRDAVDCTRQRLDICQQREVRAVDGTVIAARRWTPRRRRRSTA